MQMQARMLQLQPVMYLASIVSRALILGAVYRATLMPEDRRFLYLRFSARELWLGLVLLVLIVLIFLGAFALILPLVLVGALIVGIGGEQAAAIVPLLMLVGMGVGAWALLRMSMAPVMSFAESNFRLFESWRFTRGSALAMFGVTLAIFAIMLLFEVVVLLGAFSVVIGSAGSGGWAEAWLDDPASILKGVTPWVVIVGCVLVALISTFFYALLGAGWAEMYRQLTTGEAPAS
jgi:hypothetical protein